MTRNQVYQIRHPSFSVKGFKLLFIDWKVWQHFKVSCEQYYPLQELNVIFVGFKIAALLLIDLIRHRFENPSVKLKSFPLLSVIYKYRFLWVILNLWRGVTKKLGSNCSFIKSFTWHWILKKMTSCWAQIKVNFLLCRLLWTYEDSG